MTKINNHWHELQLPATPETLPFLEAMLTELGADAIIIADAKDQPILEPPPGQTPLWQEITLCALFQQNLNQNTITTKLEEWLPQSIIQKLQWHNLAEQDWIEKWNQTILPIAIGKKIWICPSHHPIPTEAKVPILLDPGLAFGTGQHPTTSLCLHWLDEHIKPGMTCIDYGSGSGILAVAAIKLGAQHCYAIDNDPQARLASKQNSEKNHIASEAITILAPEELQNIKVDCVIANIISNTLIELLPTLSSLIKPQGKITLSGILIDQANTICDAYTNHLTLQTKKQQDNWCLLEFANT